ncbi:MAG: DMT family transporter [Clostridia bacterium]|nr:DMT family transporter [Clostridia bacterium]
MLNQYFAILGAVIVGICVALEPTVNSGLGKYITPRLAALHSFIVGSVLILIINLVYGGFREYRLIVKAPPYFWIGGLLGVIVVYVGARVAPIIGIASTVTIMVTVQLATSILIDHLGLFGVTKVPVDAGRVAGVVLMIIAVKLIVK